MNTKYLQFPAINPNPVISVAKDNTVLYSNEATEPLMHKWNLKVGKKMPLNIIELIRRAISFGCPEEIEAQVGNKVYLLLIHHLSEDKCVNIYGFDITKKEKQKEIVQESEAYEVNMELGDVIDIQSIQSLMNDFYKLV